MAEANHKKRKQLKDSVIRVMKTELPSFKRWTEKSLFIWPGELVFHEAIISLNTFIVFSMHEQDDSLFTVDIGWSRQKRFPEIDMRPCDENPQSDAVLNEEKEFMTRLGILMNKDDCWWSVSDGSLGSIDAAVTDAVSAIKRYALPYLDGVSLHGKDF